MGLTINLKSLHHKLKMNYQEETQRKKMKMKYDFPYLSIYCSHVIDIFLYTHKSDRINYTREYIYI
jgi:hypothetical protein